MRPVVARRRPVLVVQTANDVIAIPAHAFALIEAIGERSEFVTIENAGHALLPEQPALLADTVIGWLSARSERRTSAN